MPKTIASLLQLFYIYFVILYTFSYDPNSPSQRSVPSYIMYDTLKLIDPKNGKLSPRLFPNTVVRLLPLQSADEVFVASGSPPTSPVEYVWLPSNATQMQQSTLSSNPLTLTEPLLHVSGQPTPLRYVCCLFMFAAAQLAPTNTGPQPSPLPSYVTITIGSDEVAYLNPTTNIHDLSIKPKVNGSVAYEELENPDKMPLSSLTSFQTISTPRNFGFRNPGFQNSCFFASMLMSLTLFHGFKCFRLFQIHPVHSSRIAFSI